MSATTSTMAHNERRVSYVSLTDTEASFVTPLATPSQLSQAPSQLDLNQDTPRKSTGDRSEHSGAVTPRALRSASVVTEAQRPVTAIFIDPEDNVPQEVTTDTAKETSNEVATSEAAIDNAPLTEKDTPLLVSPENQDDQVSKGAVLETNSSHTSEETVLRGKETVADTEKEIVADAEPTEASVKSAVVVSTLETVAENGNEDNIVYPGGLTLGIITLGLLLGTFVVALDNTIIATAIPSITSVFNSLDDIGWYGSSYLLCTTSLQPTFGKIYSFFNIKITYVIALVIFEVGSIVCALAKNSPMLIVGRAIAGVGAAGLFSGSLTIVGFTVPLQRRAIYLALLSSTFGIASVIGPLIGGIFTDAPNLTWRWCFWINLPFGGVALFTVLVFFKSPKREQSKLTFMEKLAEMDLLGAGVLIGAIVCLLLALQWGGTTYPWSDSRVWGCLLGFGLLIVVFTAIQFWRGERATIPPRIMKQRTVAAGCVFTALLAMGIYSTIYFLPFYFQAVKGTSAEGSGIRTIPYLVSSTLASIVVGGIVTWSGHYVPFLWLGSAIFVAGCSVIYTLKVDDGAAQWIGYQLLPGIGSGTCVQIPFISVQVVLNSKDMPIGNALTIFFNSLGGALSISIAQNLFSNTLLEKLQEQLPGLLPEEIIVAGATHVREVTPPQYLDIVLEAYNSAITHAFILPIAVSCLAFLCTLVYEWKTIKGKNLLTGGAA